MFRGEGGSQTGKLTPEDFGNLIANVYNSARSAPKGEASVGRPHWKLRNSYDAKYAPYRIGYVESEYEGSKSEKLFGTDPKYREDIEAAMKGGVPLEMIDALKRSPGFKMRKQFVFERSQVRLIENEEEIGILVLGDDVLKQTWMHYGELLNATIGPVYEALNSFSDNIRAYFTEESGNRTAARKAGVDAIEDAGRLRTATEAATKAVEEQ